jgi:ABC-type polysaccharide/polyol phosphate export permease
LTLTEVATVSVKALPWSFFVSAIRFSTNSLLSNVNLVTKIYFPGKSVPLLRLPRPFRLPDCLCVLVVLLCAARVGFSLYLLWVPLLLLILLILVAGIGIFLATANLFFRDVKYLVDVVLTFGIFFTPVFYEVSMFGKYAQLLLLNPIAPILEALNATVVLHRNPDLGWVLYSAVFALCMFTGAYAFFKRMEPVFAGSI